MKLSEDQSLLMSQWIRVNSAPRPVMGIGRITTAPAVAAIASPVAPSSVAANDDLSQPARDVQRVVEMVSKEPDVREEIVASLRERIEKGTYFVSGEQIGEMMLRRMLADRV